MDSLDVKIVRLLLQGEDHSAVNSNFRESLAVIAKEVGADQNTIRYRMKKLHESGFFSEWRLVVNPRVWGGGRAMVLVGIDPSSPKDDIIERLKLVPGVAMISSFIGRLAIVMDYDEELVLPRRVELIRRLSNSPDILVAKIPLPECKMALSSKDLDLIRVLQANPRKPLSNVAREVGFSSRTVKRKLSKMARSGVAFAWPSLDPRAVRGCLLAWLFVFYPSERKKDVDATIMRRLDDHVWHVVHMLPNRRGDLRPCAFNLAIPNVATAREIQIWAGRIPGVQDARVELHEDIFTCSDSYEAEMDKRLEQMQGGYSRKEVG